MKTYLSIEIGADGASISILSDENLRRLLDDLPELTSSPNFVKQIKPGDSIDLEDGTDRNYLFEVKLVVPEPEQQVTRWVVKG